MNMLTTVTVRVRLQIGFYLFLFQLSCLLQSTWAKLEKIHQKRYKSKFPSCIKALLISGAYDLGSSLSKLNESKIHSLEEHLNVNGGETIDGLNCCYSNEYKSMEKFSFLPGHKSIILDIPNMLNSKRGANLLSDQELKNSLVKKLMSRLAIESQRKGMSIQDGTISEANLSQFHRTSTATDTICECQFSCPFCATTFHVKFKSYWLSSNAWKHLKKSHIEKD